MLWCIAVRVDGLLNLNLPFDSLMDSQRFVKLDGIEHPKEISCINLFDECSFTFHIDIRIHCVRFSLLVYISMFAAKTSRASISISCSWTILVVLLRNIYTFHDWFDFVAIADFRMSRKIRHLTYLGRIMALTASPTILKIMIFFKLTFWEPKCDILL